VHRIRTKIDAVIIGKVTYEKDRPSLTARINEFSGESGLLLEKNKFNISGKDNFFLKKLLAVNSNELLNNDRQPIKVIIGLPYGITGDENFFKERHIIYADKKKAEDYFINNKKIRDKVNIVITESKGPEQINEICCDMASRGIMFAMLEGGGTLSGSFFESAETDQFMYFITPKIFGNGTAVLNINCGNNQGNKENSVFSEFSRLQDISTVLVGDDLIYNAYREKYNFEMM
jgi:riboflavin biosynthesis pyrimidine reductase